jgi:hypothetical protein
MTFENDHGSPFGRPAIEGIVKYQTQINAEWAHAMSESTKGNDAPLRALLADAAIMLYRRALASL